MANSIVGGLFGIDPVQLMQQRQAEQEVGAFRQAQLDPYQQLTYNAARLGQQIGNVAAPMLGIEDPQLKAASIAQNLLGQYDPTTSAGLKEYSNALREAAASTGNAQLANMSIMALDKARQLESSQAQMALTMAKTQKELRALPAGVESLIGKSTPASVAKFLQSGNVADLVRAAKTGGGSAKISFGEERYDLDKQGAINFLSQYNLKPTDKIPPNLAVTMPQLIQAQQIALRPDTKHKGGGKKEVVLTMPGGEED